MRAAALLALSLAAALAACLPIDAEEAQACRRTLPALEREGTVRVLRTAPGSVPGSVRVDYELRREGRLPLPRHVVCGFDGAAAKGDIVSLATERGAITGAALYLLKRFYVDTPEGVAGDPGAEPPSEGVPEVSAPVAGAMQALLASLPRTAIYALLSAAYALVFGLVSRINLAFGELAALGGMAATTGLGLAVGVGIAAPVGGLALGIGVGIGAAALHGAVGGWLAVGLVPEGNRQASLIATVGLSLALMEGLRLAAGPVTVWVPPVLSGSLPVVRARDFVVGVSPRALLVSGAGLLAAGLLAVAMVRTRFGRAWRACADDPLAAALLGVDRARLLTLTLALSGALAGLAGGLVVAQYGGLGFAGGLGYGLKALIAAVLGGIGSVPGALVGGVLVALFETAWSALMPIEGRDAALYAALVIVLVARPGGLFGFREARPRQV